MSKSDTQLQPTHDAAVRRVDIYLTPDEDCLISQSDAYSIYAALLSEMKDMNPEIAGYVHGDDGDSRARINNRGLIGPFKSAGPGKKRIFADESYRLTIGIADRRQDEIYEAIVKSLGFDDGTLTLEGNTLEVEEIETESASFDKLLQRAQATDDPTMRMHFRTPTVVGEINGICTLYPERKLVFSSLLRRWNMVAPDQYELALSEDEIRRHVVVSPNEAEYSVYPIVVNRGERDDGDGRYLETKQGFVGEFEISLKDATGSVKNAVVALSLFGEASGVGAYVARGCGHIDVDLEER